MQNPTQPDDPSTGTGPGADTPPGSSDPQAPPGIDTNWLNSINALYQKYLGRNASTQEALNWQNGTYGATDLPGIENQIKTSGEATAYAKAHQNFFDANPPPSGGGGGGGLNSNNYAAALSAANLGNFGVPAQEYQSKPWTQTYQRPALPSTLQTPYTPQQWTGGDFTGPGAYQLQAWSGGSFVPPTVGDALRTGATQRPQTAPVDPSTLPHLAHGGMVRGRTPVVVGERGPEVVTLPVGSHVTPNAVLHRALVPTDVRLPHLADGGTVDPAAQSYLPYKVGDLTPDQIAARQQLQATGGQSSAPPNATASTWSSFYAPTQADMANDPGYMERLRLDQQARQRSAAAQGSVLSGGTQLALGRAAQDYASNEYQNVFNRALQSRQQNVNEYQNQFSDALASQNQNFNQWATQQGLGLGAQNQSFNQALAAYNANYGRFQDQQNWNLQARQQNENEYLANQLNPSMAEYQNQYQQYLQANANSLNDYLTNYGIKRQGIQDFFNENNFLTNAGITATAAGRPTGTG